MRLSDLRASAVLAVLLTAATLCGLTWLRTESAARDHDGIVRSARGSLQRLESHDTLGHDVDDDDTPGPALHAARPQRTGGTAAGDGAPTAAADLPHAGHTTARILDPDRTAAPADQRPLARPRGHAAGRAPPIPHTLHA